MSASPGTAVAGVARHLQMSHHSLLTMLLLLSVYGINAINFQPFSKYIQETHQEMR